MLTASVCDSLDNLDTDCDRLTSDLLFTLGDSSVRRVKTFEDGQSICELTLPFCLDRGMDVRAELVRSLEAALEVVKGGA